MTRYWLRFDDLCPTMDPERWDRAERILDARGACPLLAIVPDNADPKLEVAPTDREFWNRAREWQARGWVIGLHGHRHLYDSRAPSLLPFKSVSEFSGHPRAEQRRRIHAGLTLLRGQGLEPRVWVAPGHAFDDVTLDVLRELGPRVISDGFGFRPCRDARGLTWIPQQIRRPVRFPFGTITIALHTNEMDDAAFDRLDRFLAEHDSAIVRDFSVLVRDVPDRAWSDRAWEAALLAAFRWKWRGRTRSVVP